MTKNEFIARVAVFFAGYIIVYLMCAFVEASMDPSDWDKDMRFAVAVTGSWVAVTASAIAYIFKK